MLLWTMHTVAVTETHSLSQAKGDNFYLHKQGKTVIGFPDVTDTSVQSLFLNIRYLVRRRVESKRETGTLDTSFCSF